MMQHYHARYLVTVHLYNVQNVTTNIQLINVELYQDIPNIRYVFVLNTF